MGGILKFSGQEQPMSKPFLIENRKDGASLPQHGEDTILRAALRAGRGMAYECNSGGCGGCKFELHSGEIDNLWPDAPGLSERDRRRGRLLACQCRAKSDISISAACADEYIPAIPPLRQRARLIGITDLTHDIREFRFVGSAGANFLPGQYAMLDLPGLTSSRAYSLANTANAAGEWHFQIRRVAGGQGTAILFEQLAIGDEIGLDGPYGLAHLRPEAPRDLVCVAGGSGLAPMLSIARGAAEAGLLAERQLHFFYGARSVRDVCGEAQLRALPGFGERLHFIPVVSQPEAADAWTGATGFVHEQVAARLAAPLDQYEYYFAGPPPMTQALQELLMVTHRVPFNQIHFDRFF